MAKQNKQKCMVIFTIINGKKNYIENTTNRFDNKKIPEYSTDVNNAIPFLTMKEIEIFSNKLHNPYNRKFEMDMANLVIKEVALPNPDLN
ncbi:hypothetical protein [Limnovirga soli]|uniref:Uncharacterized protein n=1 Tax=Limnovirga soli TaxID=2656915 RepID=A0A8J8FE91_9BACT|nr:hypothetical protein [Limnovirga soli]NNV55887.1 hypothetical protein [Limnovirga soli]